MHSPLDVFHVGVGGVALGVIATLLAMSILSLGIVVERAWTYRQARRRSRGLAAEAARLLSQGKLRDALTLSGSHGLGDVPLARVLAAGLQEWLDQDAAGVTAEDREWAALSTREALQHASAACVADLKRGLSVLATIGSTAPFVGLFGTTFGIIDAFAGMALTGSAGVTAVSQGISEALVTTAFGLFVAIPAVWAFNAFQGRVESLGVELERSGYQLVRHLVKRG